MSRACDVPEGLVRAVARADWSSLIPAHRSNGNDLPTGTPELIDALRLGEPLWLAIVADDSGRSYPVPLTWDAQGEVRRARVGEGAGDALVALLATGGQMAGAFMLTCCRLGEVASGERAIDVDQTNESVVVGEQAVVKWSFRAEPGPHPAPTLLPELQDRGFAGTPQPWGFLEWRPAAGRSPRLVASVVAFVPGVSDGWTWAVDDLRHAVTTGSSLRLQAMGDSLGQLVGELHVTLADRARPATAAEVQSWVAEAEDDLTRALAVTEGPPHSQLASSATRVRTAWHRLGSWDGSPPLVTSIHGDLHVGQLLRHTSGGTDRYLVTDFDGNPVVAPEHRLALQPTALDVAGVVQSLQHAALVLGRHEPHHDPADTQQRTQEVIEVFLTAYRATLASAGRSALFEPRLLLPFRLQQVCREFQYAATHLPRWSYAPQGALPLLLALLEGEPR